MEKKQRGAESRLSTRWSYLDSCRGLELEADPPRSDGLLKRWGKTGLREGKNKRWNNIHMVLCCMHAHTTYISLKFYLLNTFNFPPKQTTKIPSSCRIWRKVLQMKLLKCAEYVSASHHVFFKKVKQSKVQIIAGSCKLTSVGILKFFILRYKIHSYAPHTPSV